MDQQERKAKVTVLDAIMGAGKTSYAKQWINREQSNDKRHWLYVTPFLDEINRVIEDCPEAHFIQPTNKGKTKASDFTDLLMRGVNIVTTHVTFSTLTSEAIEYIRNGCYTLILDEVLEVLLDFNEVATHKMGRDDIPFLLNTGMIESDELLHVKWCNELFHEFRYSDVERIAKTGNLYMLDDNLLLWAFPYEAFKAFDEVLILTYMLDGSMLKPYFIWNNIEYNLASVKQLSNGEYTLCEYYNDLETRSKYKNLINIYNSKKANDYDNCSLSSSDFDRMLKDKKSKRLNKLQGQLKNFLKDFSKAKSKDILWTCKNEVRHKLKGQGYSGDDNITKKEKEAETQAERARLKAERTCFLPLNARSYNEFQIKHTLAYVANIFSNPMIKRFYNEQNKRLGTNIIIDEDKIALAMMLQWIWRSAIRAGESISIYIPSTRMRNLLIDWLNGRI